MAESPLDPISYDVLKESWEKLTQHERLVIERACKRLTVPRNAAEAYAETETVGDRLADRVASVGGSWGFVIGFGVFLATWALLNTLLPAPDRYDPYPFIFLNLLLSMLAAIQAPIIMMSQNRQAAKDRVSARLDYEVNLKAELEIAALHAKVDRLLAERASAHQGSQKV